jgi:hypothetical protein
MPNYVIEREVPGASSMTEDQVRDLTLKSSSVLAELGPDIQWLHSYVTDDRIYCIYWASNEEILREHAKRVGAPASRISAVRRMMEPVSAG